MSLFEIVFIIRAILVLGAMIIFSSRESIIFWGIQVLVMTIVFGSKKILYAGWSNQKKLFYLVETFLPGVGLFSSLLIIAIKGLFPRGELEQEDEGENLKLGPAHREQAEQRPSLGFQAALDFTPESYLRLIKFGSKEQKMRVLETLAKAPLKKSVRLLQEAMNDPEYEVRYFSNNLLLSREGQIISELQALDGKIRVNPQDEQALLARAQGHMELVALNISEEFLKKKFLDKALFDLLSLMQMRSQLPELWNLYFENLYRRGDYAQMLEQVKSKAYGPQSPDLKQWIEDAQFQLGLTREGNNTWN